MSIAERVRQLNLPADEFIVIGSGVLDALGLRQAGDIDLVMTAELFARIVQLPDWQVAAKHGELIASNADAEAFLSWGSDGRPNFDELQRSALVIDGIQYADPRFVIDWKQQRGTDKDLRDVELLKEYIS